MPRSPSFYAAVNLYCNSTVRKSDIEPPIPRPNPVATGEIDVAALPNPGFTPVPLPAHDQACLVELAARQCRICQQPIVGDWVERGYFSVAENDRIQLTYGATIWSRSRICASPISVPGPWPST